jgi:photosystem II stability/assembly factor-like uncharacterized protein
MKKLFLPVFLFFALFVEHAHGQTFTQQLPLPDGPLITSLSFVDSTLGFASGHGGRILKTSNSGNNWTALNTGTTDNINGLVCQDAQNIFACTETGDLLQSSDGGQNWTSTSISTFPLNKIYFHQSKLFVLGGNGQLFLNPHLDFGNLTIPIGGSWANLDHMFWMNDKIGFLFADSTHPFAGKTVLYRTTNGGFSWQRNSRIQSVEGAPTDTIYRDFSWKNLHHIITMPDSSLLMAGGYYPGYIYKSIDKGLTFKILFEIVQVNPQQIHAFSQSKIALISWEGDALFPYIARNRNGGIEWHQYINDTTLFRLNSPFRPWGKAVFFNNHLGFIPGYNQNINGTTTGAILRIRNVFPEGITTAIREVEKSEVNVYPVPANNILWMEGMENMAQVQILNSMGQTMNAPIVFSEGIKGLEVKRFPPGIYMLKAKNKLVRFLKE